MLSEPLMGEAEDDNYKWLRLFATVTAVALGSSLQFGFATGSLNNLEQIVPEDLAAAGNPIVTWQWALINSMFSVGGLIGSYGVVVPLAYFGRKNTLLLANFFVFLSSALMYLGTVWWVLVLGRVSIGVVAGVAQMVAGSYMTEISPIGVRGSVGVCSQVGIVLGISLASYLTAPSFAVFGTIDRWRFTFLVPCVSSPSSSACSRQPQPCARTPALHPAPCAVRLAPDPSPRRMQVPLLALPDLRAPLLPGVAGLPHQEPGRGGHVDGRPHTARMRCEPRAPARGLPLTPARPASGRPSRSCTASCPPLTT